ncbi:PH domain protein [Aspergillus lucknowensis]|uniref:PH domain-containing protein n=1 Tax=Aspergillus lucknowensis TaxID=176173 RepID=A0ABR4LH30_9EURO
MVRSRVLSFISSFGGSSRRGSPDRNDRITSVPNTTPRFGTPSPDTPSPHDSPPSKAEQSVSRPRSTVFSQSPPFMQLADDTPAELQRIFAYLNSHANKLFYEGYFLKLNDLDTNGRPCADRQWVECYAQLVGTVLSLWDVSVLDAAGNPGDVPPTFINLADASVKTIETLPTQSQTGAQSLRDVLSVSSAGQNRYLLHFDSHESLIQWAAAIRLAMYENTCLHEAYTGSIIAAKGRELNGIGAILERNRFKHEDWARVRFGAGTPWRRCWFVITPPDEKELQKAKKTMKKKSAYDRAPRLVIGNIKFYETKKTKKVKPIATVTDAYCAYAIYPQSKALIDQSTLVKIEGNFILHSQSESKNEGFVFVMPEVHPAVSGFEIMLRFLIPTFDTFNLYGRPTRLIAAVNHIKSIMFAFPDQECYDYVNVMDIANLMQTSGSQNWSEAEWRRQLKDATARRLANVSSRTSSSSASKPRFRNSIPNPHSNVSVGHPGRKGHFPGFTPAFNQSVDAIVQHVPKEESFAQAQHSRSISDTAGFAPSALPRSAMESSAASSAQDLTESPVVGASPDRSSSEEDWKRYPEQGSDPPFAPLPTGQQSATRSPPSDVAPPPAFTRDPRERPSTRPEPSPEARRATVRMSDATLAQLVAASGNMNFTERPTTSASYRSSDLTQNNHTQPITSHGVSRPQSLTHAPSGYTDQQANPQEEGPPVPKHNFGTIEPLSAKANRQSTQSIRIDTERAVKRKPLTHPSPQAASPQTSAGEPSLDDLRHTVDEDAMNLIGIVNRPTFHSPKKATLQEEESVYDDESAASPDYASTGGSLYSKSSAKSIHKPRMGVMKTVGTEQPKDVVIGDAHYSLDTKPEQNPNIPAIDFGPTLTYLPTTRRPSTSDTLKKFEHHRTGSDATERQRFSVPARPKDRHHSRSPSRDEYRRSVLWQPAMAAPRPITPGGGLTPEQFVQQRAAPSPPLHVHRRSPSTSTSTLPPRPVSGDWMAHTRSPSQMSLNRDSQPRPKSRGASSMINYNDISSHLTAREQEHVARVTGSSFFNLSSDTKKPPPVNPMGLVGAIDAREQEKRLMKEGMSGQMVQHAIAQRQHHWQHQQPQPQSLQQIAPVGPPHPSYGVQAGSNSLYNIPTANRTWDALNQPYRPEEPRRQSWYSQFPTQPAQTSPPMHQTQQPNSQHGHFGNTNTPYY